MDPAGRARLLIKAVYVVNAEAAGTETQRMYVMGNIRKKRIKHNDLTHYFLRDREELPKAYLKKVDKFMWEIRNNLITKQDAAVLYKLKQDNGKH